MIKPIFQDSIWPKIKHFHHKKKEKRKEKKKKKEKEKKKPTLVCMEELYAYF